jgi:hypothetical protein
MKHSCKLSNTLITIPDEQVYVYHLVVITYGNLFFPTIMVHYLYLMSF